MVTFFHLGTVELTTLRSPSSLQLRSCDDALSHSLHLAPKVGTLSLKQRSLSWSVMAQRPAACTQQKKIKTVGAERTFQIFSGNLR
jgi:hypothetical protein